MYGMLLESVQHFVQVSSFRKLNLYQLKLNVANTRI